MSTLSKSDYKLLLDRYKKKTEAIRKSTINSVITETPEEKAKRIAYLLKPKNYAEFFDYYFGQESNIPLADAMSSPYHVQIYEDLYNNNSITIGNFLFRGGAKSTHANLGYITALKQSGKAHFFLIIGANEVRAFMLLQDLQIQLEHNQRYINDFGIQKENGSWAEGQFATKDGCTFMAVGINQPFRGLRQNGIRVEYASVDDIEDAKNAMNQELVNEYVDKITGDLEGAFSMNSERLIVNNNYFVKKGFIDHLMERKGVKMSDVDTRHNNIIKKKFVHVYQINLTDKYFPYVTADSDDWHPSWDRFSREYCLRKIEKYQHDKATLSNEFYNTPIKVGKLFKPEMIKWVEPMPLDKYDLLVAHWDLSYTAKGDTKAMALIGCKGTKLVLLDIFCRHCDMETVYQYHFIKSNHLIRKNPNYLCYYDANVAQKAIYEPEFAEAAKRYRSTNIPLPNVNSTNKYLKIYSVLGSAIMNGTLLFSEELKNNPDWDEASTQLFGFEFKSKLNDDFPDAVSEAIRMAKENYTFDGLMYIQPRIGHPKRHKKY